VSISHVTIRQLIDLLFWVEVYSKIGRQFIGLDFNYSCKAAVGKIQILLNYPAGGYFVLIFRVAGQQFTEKNSKLNYIKWNLVEPGNIYSSLKLFNSLFNRRVIKITVNFS